MKNSERQKFEQSWKSAFDGAESTPPESVWNSIELDLAGRESATMKKKVVFYQRVAAAMLLFALSAGVYAYYSSSNDRSVNSEQRAKSNVQHSTNEKPPVKTEKGSNDNSIQKENPAVTVTDEKREEQRPQQLAFVENTEEKIEVAKEEVNAEQTINAEQVNKEQVNKEEEKKEPEHKVTEVVSPLLQPLLETPETVVEPKRIKKQKESLWLALGGSAGNYTPNTPTATTPAVSQSSFADKGPALSFVTTSAPKPQPKVGSSFSVGLGVGKRFGRFVVQTGVNLNKQQINYTSNYDTHTASHAAEAAMSDYIGQNADLTFTNEYTVSSTMDIVSIPVQFGYMIVDRKLGWQINVGASNDFFLRNTLVDKSGQRDKFTQEAGSGSPYRSINYSALAGMELSYRIGQHYRISLVPGARYSFHSILKNTTDTGRPIILDVGFRFRYIFD